MKMENQTNKQEDYLLESARENKEFNLSELGIDGKELGILYHQGSIKEFIKMLKEEGSDVNKHLDLHNVDECECCEKNWKCVYEILEIIDKLAGKSLI